MSEKKMGRRDLMRRSLTVLGAAAFAPAVLAGCGGGSDELSCMDTTGLAPGDIATRQAQNYVDATPNPAQRCDNCRFWQAPQQEGSCGGCQVVRGPIHPAGHCDLWAAEG